MKFNLAFVDGPQRVEVLELSGQEVAESKIMSFDQIEPHTLSGIILDKNVVLDSEENKNLFNKLSEFSLGIPVRTSSEINVKIEEIKRYTLAQSKSLLQKVQSSWVLQNNLSLLDQIFETVKHLRLLWENDRTTFIQEFWHLMKKNLGTTHLQIFYHDIELASSENQKNKLVLSSIGYNFNSTPAKANEMEQKLFSEIYHPTDKLFEVIEYNKEKSELVLLCTIDEGPLLLMASVNEMSTLQQVLISSLIKGLQLK
ncbi:MAG: hypothetical protein H6622_06995 [Halobacteriovoraceae bacterium]|nr:hypothetical protein [Halobacteriovoraceae bacterium]